MLLIILILGGDYFQYFTLHTHSQFHFWMDTKIRHLSIFSSLRDKDWHSYPAFSSKQEIPETDRETCSIIIDKKKFFIVYL